MYQPSSALQVDPIHRADTRSQGTAVGVGPGTAAAGSMKLWSVEQLPMSDQHGFLGLREPLPVPLTRDGRQQLKLQEDNSRPGSLVP